ncbi:MAG TPA: (Fe-S)-binding protein [Rectinemataceae bacterium]|nr:(Fe-S)-binding protein [Rectinemataceae bacterium]
MSPWLVYPLSFLLFFAGGGFCALFAKALTRKVGLSQKELEARGILPGHDCGLCGEPSCRAFATSLVAGKADLGRCAPGGAELETRLRGLFEGSEAKGRVAVVRCAGSRKDSPDLFEYSGIQECAAAQSIYDGPRACRDSCLGYGSCLSHCPVSAIAIVEGLAVVDPQRCTGCGACVEACPTGVIALIPADDPLFVSCNSRLPAAERVGICQAACNGCRACERPDGAPSFVVDKGLARRSSWKIADSASFVRSCPTKVIREPRHAAKNGINL